MDYVLASISWAFQYVILFLCQSIFLKRRWSWGRFLTGTFLYFFLCSLLKSVIIDSNVNIIWAAVFTILVAGPPGYFIFFDNSHRLRLSSNLLCFAITIEMEVSSVYIQALLSQRSTITEIGSSEYFSNILLFNIYFVCTLIPAYLILKRTGIKLWKGYRGFFWVMPLGHILLNLYVVSNLWYHSFQLSSFFFLCSMTMLAADYYAIWIQIKYEKIKEEEISDLKRDYEQRIKEFRDKFQLPQYREMQKERHDINNKISTAVYLIERSKWDEAKILLDEMDEILS